MLYNRKIFMTIVGAVLTLGSLTGIIAGIVAGNGGTTAVLSVFFGIFLVGGVLMLVFGLRNVIRVSKNNSELLKRNSLYVGSCRRCGTQIQCNVRAFASHRRFREGFVYCPECRNPISRNTMQEFPGQNNLPGPGPFKIVQ